MDLNSISTHWAIKGFGLLALGLMLAMSLPAAAALTLQLNVDGHATGPSFEIDGAVSYDPVARNLSLDIIKLKSSALHNPLFCHDFDSGDGVIVNVGVSDAGAQQLLRDLVHSASISYLPSEKTLTISPRPSVQCFYTQIPGELGDFGLFGAAPTIAGGLLPVEGLIFRDSFIGEVILTAVYDNVVVTDGLEYDVTVTNTGQVAANEIFIQELMSTAQAGTIESCELVDLDNSSSTDCLGELPATDDGQLAFALPFALKANTALVLRLVRTGPTFSGPAESTAQLLGVVNGRSRSASFATDSLSGQDVLPPAQ